jgi:hypothetical protein
MFTNTVQLPVQTGGGREDILVLCPILKQFHHFYKMHYFIWKVESLQSFEANSQFKMVKRLFGINIE